MSYRRKVSLFKLHFWPDFLAHIPGDDKRPPSTPPSTSVTTRMRNTAPGWFVKGQIRILLKNEIIPRIALNYILFLVRLKCLYVGNSWIYILRPDLSLHPGCTPSCLLSGSAWLGHECYSLLEIWNTLLNGPQDLLLLLVSSQQMVDSPFLPIAQAKSKVLLDSSLFSHVRSPIRRHPMVTPSRLSWSSSRFLAFITATNETRLSSPNLAPLHCSRSAC